MTWKLERYTYTCIDGSDKQSTQTRVGNYTVPLAHTTIPMYSKYICTVMYSLQFVTTMYVPVATCVYMQG